MSIAESPLNAAEPAVPTAQHKDQYVRLGLWFWRWPVQQEPLPDDHSRLCSSRMDSFLCTQTTRAGFLCASRTARGWSTWSLCVFWQARHRLGTLCQVLEQQECKSCIEWMLQIIHKMDFVLFISSTLYCSGKHYACFMQSLCRFSVFFMHHYAMFMQFKLVFM